MAKAPRHDPDSLESSADRIATALASLARNLPDCARSDHPLLGRTPNEVAENGLASVAEALDGIAHQLSRIADALTTKPGE
jgi:hypothetical protein